MTCAEGSNWANCKKTFSFSLFLIISTPNISNTEIIHARVFFFKCNADVILLVVVG